MATVLDSSKENLDPNCPHWGSLPRSKLEADYLRRQLQIEHQLNRQMLLQVSRERAAFSSRMLDSRSNGREQPMQSLPLCLCLSSEHKLVEDVPLINSVTAGSNTENSAAELCSVRSSITSNARPNRHLE
jgi:hypothetical protein